MFEFHFSSAPPKNSKDGAFPQPKTRCEQSAKPPGLAIPFDNAGQATG